MHQTTLYQRATTVLCNAHRYRTVYKGERATHPHQSDVQPAAQIASPLISAFVHRRGAFVLAHAAAASVQC